MAFILTGIVQGMRPVGNREDAEFKAGEKWRFLSLEVADARSGVHSCQLSDKNPQYKEFVDPTTYELLKDYTGHKVKLILQSVAPGMRDEKDKDGKVISTDPIVRIRIARIDDLGLPKDDE